MKKKLIFLILLSNYLLSTAQKPIYFNKKWEACEKSEASYYRIVKQKKDLYFIQDFYINGVLQFEGMSSTKNDPFQMQGPVTYYYADGNIQSKAMYVNNILEDTLLQYYNNGKVRRELVYIHGKLNGICSDYFPSGELSKRANFVDDEMNGEFVKYCAPHLLELKANYKLGQIVGQYEQYYYGKLITKGTANNNQQEGKCQEFYGEDIPVLWKEYFIKDLFVDGNYLSYAKNRDTICKGFFKNGICQSFSSKSADLINGSIFSSEMQLSNGIEDWKTYRDGTLILESFYKNGAKIGLWKMYTKDGKRLYESKLYGDDSASEPNEQKIKENFSWHLQLGDRFDLNTYPFSNGELAKEHSEYYKTDTQVDLHDDPFYAVKSGDTFETPILESMEVPQIIEEMTDYESYTLRQSFIDSNHCITPFELYTDVTMCSRSVGGLRLFVIKSDKASSLKEIKYKLEPKDDEVYFLCQNIVPDNYSFTRERPKRYISFVLSKSMKEAMKRDIIDPRTIIYFYENIVFKDNRFHTTECMTQLTSVLNGEED